MFTMFNIYEKPAGFIVGLLILSIWSLIWKGLGLWHSGKHQQKWWFVFMLIFNTAGLLPIIYLIWFKPKKEVVVKLSKKPAVKKAVEKKPTKKMVKKEK